MVRKTHEAHVQPLLPEINYYMHSAFIVFYLETHCVDAAYPSGNQITFLVFKYKT